MAPDASLFLELLARGAHASLRARGGSMWPALRDGDVLTVAPLTHPPVRGEVVAALRDGALTVHRVHRTGDGGSDNENETQNPSNSGTAGSSARASVFLRGDALAREDPPFQPEQLIGRVVRARRAGREIPPLFWRGPVPLLLRPLTRAALRLARRLRAPV